jgi:hypothetical protein
VKPLTQTPEPAAQPQNRSDIEVVTPNGFVVRLKGGADIESIKRVFRVLEE